MLGIMFVSAGILHFVEPEPFVRIVPSYLPEPLLLVWISGFFEIVGGIGLFISRLRVWAAYGLIALLIAVFPANINMAVNNINFNGAIPNAALWLRLPLQLVLIACVWWSSISKERSP
jgi:uncharacterized membrane protein